MSVFRQLTCAFRGGHDWKTLSDVEGSVTYCVRCEKTQHIGTDFDPPGNPRGQADVNKVAEIQRTAGLP